MIWAFIAANLKYIIAGGVVIWIANVFKENGRVKKEIEYTKSKNKKLAHQQEFQVLEIKRSEEQAKNANEYAKSVEDVLKKIDPTALDNIALDKLSQDPLVNFEDFYSSTGELTQSSKKEDDK